MALNPVAYIEKVAKSFLRYQLTAYPFSDPHLLAQMRDLLSLDHTRASPLLRGPYVSLSRPFRDGAPVQQMVDEGFIHPHLVTRIPSKITHFYSHQERAIRSIADGRTTLISTGTGSGKTECFLYPVVSQALTLKDESAAPGISAVIVYPMNALARGPAHPDSRAAGRHRRALRHLRREDPGAGGRCGRRPPPSRVVACRLLGAGEEGAAGRHRRDSVPDRRGLLPPGQCGRPASSPASSSPTSSSSNSCSRGSRTSNSSRERASTTWCSNEAHTFTGAMGAETACLIRRLRSFCNIEPGHTRCIATSATIVDPKEPDAALNFAARFFGVPVSEVVTVGEDYEAETWAEPRVVPPAPKGNPSEILGECVRAVEDGSGAEVKRVYRSCQATPCGSRKAPDGPQPCTPRCPATNWLSA